MPVAWALTVRRDGILNLTPPLIKIAKGSQAGKDSYSGSWRVVRATITGSGTYAAGGTALTEAQTGLRHIEGVFVLTDGATIAAAAGQLRFNTTTGNLELWTLAGAELGAVSAAGAHEVLILGKS